MAILGPVSEVTQSTINAAIAVFGPLFEALIGDYASSEFFFAKVLLLILIFVIINVVLKKIPMFGDNKMVAFLVAFVVSVFAVRFISDNQLTQGILLPYGTLGVALTTLLPFIIFFYFVHNTEMGPLGRRVSWIFFLVVFLLLWVYKAEELSQVSNYIYTFTLVAVALATIFDSSFHKYFGLAGINKAKKKFNMKHLANLKAELQHLLSVPNPDDFHIKRRIHDIERSLERLGK
jgi:hypothetical protein